MPDNELWSDILNGDSRAWKALVAQYESLVYTVVTRTGLSYHEAADCFQQTWVLLYESRKKIQDPARLPGWLATTARREALKTLKRGRRNVELDETSDTYVDTGALPDEEMEKIELQSQLTEALALIDDRCAKLLKAMLLDPDDESYEQIAARFGISSNALGPARRRCLDRLKGALEKIGFRDARTESVTAQKGRKTINKKSTFR
jgi:RNA polymerase sigma factor (sigma-70 family)